MKQNITSMGKIRIHYDRLWKDVVGENIEDFLAMFLPALHLRVDYTAKIEYLEQELKSALKDKTHKLADKLIKLQLKDGGEEWVCVHVEFETKPKEQSQPVCRYSPSKPVRFADKRRS